MPEFKKGQLVAVKEPPDTHWSLRVFERYVYTGETYCVEVIVRRPESGSGYCVCLQFVRPVEQVWPDVFLGWDRRAREQSDHAVEMEAALVQRLRRQVAWLCQELAHADMCPSISCDKDCPRCWEQASLKAVREREGAGTEEAH